MQQLDIFDDGRDVMRANDMIAALLANQLPGARDCLAAWRAEFPDHAGLPPAQALLAELADRAEAPFTDHLQAAAALQHWQTVHEPAAAALLGPGPAADWRALRLAEFACRAQSLPWRPTQPDTHAAALWLAARQWNGALQALTTVPSWRRQPQLLTWAAECRWRHSGADSAWPLLAELAWLAPARLPQLVAVLGDARLSRWLARMDEDLDVSSPAWFPAWVLIEQPLLAEPLALAERSTHGVAEQAFGTVLALLRLERQGRHRDVIAHRLRLRGQNEALFACYMKTR